jgi:hypothetical protein
MGQTKGIPLWRLIDRLIPPRLLIKHCPNIFPVWKLINPWGFYNHNYTLVIFGRYTGYLSKIHGICGCWSPYFRMFQALLFCDRNLRHGCGWLWDAVGKSCRHLSKERKDQNITKQQQTTSQNRPPPARDPQFHFSGWVNAEYILGLVNIHAVLGAHQGTKFWPTFFPLRDTCPVNPSGAHAIHRGVQWAPSPGDPRCHPR